MLFSNPIQLELCWLAHSRFARCWDRGLPRAGLESVQTRRKKKRRRRRKTKSLPMEQEQTQTGKTEKGLRMKMWKKRRRKKKLMRTWLPRFEEPASTFFSSFLYFLFPS